MNERPIPTFADVMYECANTPEFVPLFNKLTGYHLTSQSAPDSTDAQAFAAFVDARVWQPVLAERARAEAAENN
jgi:hypothetical protein